MMKQLPTPEVYEKEYTFFPWGVLAELVEDFIISNTPTNGKLIDLACGPGYLLGKIQKKRKDLHLSGVDIDSRYIEYAKDKYKNVQFEQADVLSWEPKEKFDVVICTAGLHHLSYENQPELIRKMSEAITDAGFVIAADPYIDNFSNEKDRKVAAAKLGYEYIVATIQKDAPTEIIQAALDIQLNDIMGHEYKTSLQKILPIFKELFQKVEVKKVWPDRESEYGDYILIASKKYE